MVVDARVAAYAIMLEVTADTANDVVHIVEEILAWDDVVATRATWML